MICVVDVVVAGACDDDDVVITVVQIDFFNIKCICIFYLPDATIL